MISRITFTARRRAFWSLFISGGAHVAVVGGVLLGAQFGWLPQPFPTQANDNSIRLLASTVPAESVRVHVTTMTPLAAELFVESEKRPIQLESLFPAEYAEVATHKQEPLQGHLPDARIADEALAALPRGLVVEHLRIGPRKTDSEARLLSAVPFLSVPQPRSGDQTTLPDSIASLKVESVEADPIDSREIQGAEFERLPAPLFNPAPVYPAAALAERREGRVILRVSIDKTGRVADLAVLRSSGDDQLDRAALQAVRQWRFTPGQRLGQNAAGTVAIPVVFRIAP